MKKTHPRRVRATPENEWEHHIPGETRPAPDVRILNRGTVVVCKVSRMLTVNHRGMRYRLLDPVPESLLCELEDGHVELFNGSPPSPGGASAPTRHAVSMTGAPSSTPRSATSPDG